LADSFPPFFQRYYSIFESGVTLRNKGKYKEAIISLMHAFELAQKIKNVEGQALCLENLGILYWNIGRLEDSLGSYQKALFIAESHNLNELKKRCQNAIEIYKFYREGKDFRASNEYSKSIESFKKAIFVSRQLGCQEHELKCLRQLSLSYEDSNNLKEFFYLNEIALKIAGNINHKREEGRCLINIGNFFRRVANYSQALNYYDQALNISKNTKDKKDESICLNNIGIIYQGLGDYERALEYLKNALIIDQYLKDDINISMDLNNIGAIFHAKGINSGHQDELCRSLYYFNKCLQYTRNSICMKDKIKIKKKTEVQALNNIGTVLIDLKNMNKAKEYLLLGHRKAVEIKDLEIRSMVLVNLGIVYLNQNNYKESKESLQNAIKLANEIDNKQILWEAHFGLGQCYEKTHKYFQSVECYKNAVDVIDMIRSKIVLDSYNAGFARDKIKVYESLISLLYRMSMRNPSVEISREIFNITEKAKARAFLENLVLSKVDINSRLSPKLRKSENEISNRIFFLKQQLFDSDLSEKRRKELIIELHREEDKYVSLISKVKLEVPKLRNLISLEPCRLEQIQQNLLNKNTALIEYFLGENQSIMFLITKNEFCVFSLPSRIKIENSIRAFLKVLSNYPHGKFKGILAAKRIYNELIFPAEKKISAFINNLIIIPDGILYYLPFEALIKNMKDQIHVDRYLIEDYRISYSPSSSILLFLSRNHHKQDSIKGLLAFGNPFYPFKTPARRNEKIIYAEVFEELLLNTGFIIYPLPYSGREVLKISKYFGHEKRDIFLKKNAKEEIIKEISLINYKIIHFACHALLDEEFPFRSALILAIDDDMKEDGFLQVREIYNLKLDADLVVLSACQTGRGKLEKGEGILGFPRIFFYVGAKSVVLSLWKINDKSTSVFMDYFYYYLSQGNEKTQALRKAKLKMLESKFNHPFYWAAYILNGDFDSPIIFK